MIFGRPVFTVFKVGAENTQTCCRFLWVFFSLHFLLFFGYFVLFCFFFPLYIFGVSLTWRLQSSFIDGALSPFSFLLLRQQLKPFSSTTLFFPPLSPFVLALSESSLLPQREKGVMSGLYNPNYSPARAASPQIRSAPDVDR